MFRPLLILLLSFVTVFHAAQAQDLGRTRAALAGRLPDTTRARLLLDLAEATVMRQPDTALQWSGQALGISRKQNYPKGQARAHFVQAQAKLYQFPADLPGAGTALSLARTDYAQLHDLSGQLKCVLLEAALAVAKGDHRAAFSACAAADSMAVDSLGRAWRSSILLQRGAVYADIGMARGKSLPLYRQAIQVAEGLAETDAQLPLGYARLGELYTFLGQPDSAVFWLDKAVTAWEDLENLDEYMFATADVAVAALAARDSASAADHALNGLRTQPRDSSSLARAATLYAQGQVMLSIANPDSAMRLFRRALALQRRTARPAALVATRLGISTAYIARFDYSGALRHADSAQVLADSIQDLPLQLQVANFQAELYNRLGDARNALRLRERAWAIQGVLSQRREDRLRSGIQVLAEEEARASRSAEAQSIAAADNPETARWKRWAWYGGLGLAALLLLLLLFVVIRQGRHIRNLRIQAQGEKAAADEAYEDLARMEDKLTRSNTTLEQLVDERTDALKGAIDSLLEVNEELDTFIYRASHDLLGPIARLKGLVLVAQSSDETALRNLISLISSVSIYMDRVLRKLVLVRDLKFQAGGVQPVDLVALITEIEPHLCELPGIDTPDISVEDWVRKPVNVDAYNLRIVLENLLENACIFRRDSQNASPQIEVKLRREGRMITLEVEDQGIGIPDEIRDQVFDIFFRGSERSKGNGLGLYLVRRAVEGLNGTIAIESKAGTFTRCVVKFPEVG
jgi:signal transduction histidine kinase